MQWLRQQAIVNEFGKIDYDPKRFTIRTARARLEDGGDPMASVLGAGVDIAAALARLNVVSDKP